MLGYFYNSFEFTSNAFEIEIELLANTLRLKRHITEIPSRERERMGGKPKSLVLRHGILFFFRIIFETLRKAKKIEGTSSLN